MEPMRAIKRGTCRRMILKYDLVVSGFLHLLPLTVVAEVAECFDRAFPFSF